MNMLMNRNKNKKQPYSLCPGRFKSFKKLVEFKEWDKIRKIFSQSTTRASSFCSEVYEAELTSLGLAICQNAPTDIIESMIKIDPSLISGRDVFGLNVLHLGCLNGASLRIVELILRNHGYLVKEVDGDGRSPLHHATEYATYCALEDVEDHFYYIEVVEAVCHFAPGMTIIPDKHGVTPIDMVQDMKIKTEIESMEYDRLEIIYVILKTASIKHYQANQVRWIDQRIQRESGLYDDMTYSSLVNMYMINDNDSDNGGTAKTSSILTTSQYSCA